jgi:pyrimidine-nucleoside phosphorylase
MKMIDLLEKKKQGLALTKEEIEFFVEGYTKGDIPDYQASALLMAIYLKKMNKEETAHLTLAMANSGDILHLSEVEGIKVDKHSTGGVGDTTTLVVAPMVAALGIPVAKMSGRGLGHTGGTIDKLESFEGFSVEMSENQFVRNLNTVKVALVGQTKDLAPADKKLYALRDVTATVNDLSLISSSIMSKKIAAGADCILLDVKVGDGAFMKTHEEARELAKAMVEIGKNVGRTTVAIISDMDQPLGYAIGNALEVKEAIDTLQGKGPEDLLELCVEIGANMVLLAKKANTKQQAKEMLRQTIVNGSALSKFKEFIIAQGGSVLQIEDTALLPKAKYQVEVGSVRSGYVNKINTQNFGNIALELGAGRKTKEDVVDLGVGIVLKKKRGDKVEQGEVLAVIHANDETKIEQAKKEVIENYLITEEKGDVIPLIYEVIG